jgi:hypothetical protein
MPAGWTKHLLVSNDIRPVITMNLEEEKAWLGRAFLVEIPFGVRLDGDGYLFHPSKPFEFTL